MKKYLMAGILFASAACVSPANAYVCSFEHCEDTGQLGMMLGCATGQISLLGCLQGKKITTCNQCKSGYTRKEQRVYHPSYGCDYSYYSCEKECTGCPDCVSDLDWSAYGVGYQSKTTRSCNCNTCNAQTSYRCAPGYYGTCTNGTSGCTQCPDSGTSDAGSGAITLCYLPRDTGGTDNSGDFIYTDNCFYAD